jgi:hypothetical protein
MIQEVHTACIRLFYLLSTIGIITSKVLLD